MEKSHLLSLRKRSHHNLRQLLVAIRTIVFAFSIAGLSATPVEISFSLLAQEYDGTPKFPVITTDPPGQELSVSMVSRNSEIVYQSVPTPYSSSYPNWRLANLPDKALGDLVTLGGTDRYLESIDVVLVTWATAGNFPALASENANGYTHPVTVFVYRRNDNGSLSLLAQSGQNVLVPWRPETLDDGTPYPFNGFAFNTRFNFPGDVLLSENIAVFVAYNTQNTGFDPIGVPGPYQSLNIALHDTAPIIGSDFDSNTILRFQDEISSTSGFVANAPIFTVRAFPASPPTITSAVEAGQYRIQASVITPGFEGMATTNFEITPAPAAITLSDLSQTANGSPRNVTVITAPSGLAFDVEYARRDSPPSEPGLHPFFVNILSPNYSGRASGSLFLGSSFETWISGFVASGKVAPELSSRDDDPDDDGLSNFLEYGGATDPSDPLLIPLLKIDEESSTSGVQLQYSRNIGAADLSYELQSSPDLGRTIPWTKYLHPMQIEGTEGDRQTINVSHPILPTDPKRYFRLKISTP